ncbi:shikimate kinase [Labilibaculum sp. K2S]|uniref:shikimate kinase n=1 Tax=Labilibaculum sp. K2S TaxID=3056386 RepID=UPI0025A33F66|nr:shikimate kinase [Labilibaculum sp. K2S]MDM8160436.1 shikimate kinase [Labilibaculum sp. K2S]
MKDLILIGPVAVGKTTTAKLLSEKLNKPLISMDDLRFDYYKEIGYDNNHMKHLFEKAGIMAIYQYGKIFDAYSIERILEDHQNCIFDFGGGNNASGFNFEFKRLKKALNPYENIVLLFPCADKEESLNFICKRRNFTEIQKELIEHIVMDESNFRLATHIVFVKDKTPEEVCNEVLLITNNLQQNNLISNE